MRTRVVMLLIVVSGMWTRVECVGLVVVSGPAVGRLQGDWRVRAGSETVVKGVRRGLGGDLGTGAVSWSREGGERGCKGLRRNDMTIQGAIQGFRG